MKRAAPTEVLELGRVEVIIIMICGGLQIISLSCNVWRFFKVKRKVYLIKVLLSISPIPCLTTIRSPIIERSSASSDPGVVVKAATSTKDLSSRIRFLDTGVVRSVNHGSFIRPVIFATSELESTSGRGNGWDVTRFSVYWLDSGGHHIFRSDLT